MAFNSSPEEEIFTEITNLFVKAGNWEALSTLVYANILEFL